MENTTTVHMPAVMNAKDAFSKDLVGTYELDGLDNRIRKFRTAFENQAG